MLNVVQRIDHLFRGTSSELGPRPFVFPAARCPLAGTKLCVHELRLTLTNLPRGS